MITNICPVCNTPFTSSRTWKRFCSKRCQQRQWQAQHTVFIQQLQTIPIDPAFVSAGIWVATFPEPFRYSCGVYGFYRDGQYLYIGKAIRFAERLINHHVIGKKFPIHATDVLHLWLSNPDRFELVETQLITYYRPPFNSVAGRVEPGPGLILPEPDHIVPLTPPKCKWCDKTYNPSIEQYHGFCCGDCASFYSLHCEGRDFTGNHPCGAECKHVIRPSTAVILKPSLKTV